MPKYLLDVEKLKTLMELRGLNKKTLAEKASVSRTDKVSLWFNEKGAHELTETELQKLTKALRVDRRQLIRLSEQSQEYILSSDLIDKDSMDAIFRCSAAVQNRVADILADHRPVPEAVKPVMESYLKGRGRELWPGAEVSLKELRGIDLQQCLEVRIVRDDENYRCFFLIDRYAAMAFMAPRGICLSGISGAESDDELVEEADLTLRNLFIEEESTGEKWEAYMDLAYYSVWDISELSEIDREETELARKIAEDVAKGRNGENAAKQMWDQEPAYLVIPGENLNLFLKDKRMSKSELERVSGISRQTIGDICKQRSGKKVELFTAICLADALGIDLSVLLHPEGYKRLQTILDFKRVDETGKYQTALDAGFAYRFSCVMRILEEPDGQAVEQALCFLETMLGDQPVLLELTAQICAFLENLDAQSTSFKNHIRYRKQDEFYLLNISFDQRIIEEFRLEEEYLFVLQDVDEGRLSKDLEAKGRQKLLDLFCKASEEKVYLQLVCNLLQDQNFKFFLNKETRDYTPKQEEAFQKEIRCLLLERDMADLFTAARAEMPQERLEAFFHQYGVQLQKE